MLCLLFAGITSCRRSPEPVPAAVRVAVDLPGSVVDLAGAAVNPWESDGARAIVLLFLSNDCPIANRYVPDLRRLQGQFAPRGVRFYWVHALAEETPEAIRQHARDYGIEGTILRDPHHDLVRRSKVEVTPEAAVFSPEGRLVYHGSIDNRYVELGVERSAPTEHYLADALQAVLAGALPLKPEMPAVGCYIPELP